LRDILPRFAGDSFSSSPVGGEASSRLFCLRSPLCSESARVLGEREWLEGFGPRRSRLFLAKPFQVGFVKRAEIMIAEGHAFFCMGWGER